MAGQIQTLQEMINQVVKGKQKVVEKVLCAMLAGGHILLEDIPGVGKTTLAMAIAKATNPVSTFGGDGGRKGDGGWNYP